MADFTITFLGTGTSQGVPVIGCDCRVCRSEDSRDRRSRASIYVETPESAFVIDTGPDFRMQCLREDVRRVNAVVFTHSHTDHMMGFDDLRPFCPGGAPLSVYGSETTIHDLQRVFIFAFNGENRFPGYVNPVPNIITEPFQLGETLLTPLPVPHGRSTVFGYLFTRNGERLAAYLSDCKSVPPAIIEQIRGVKHLILDALRYKPHPTHMCVEEALAVAAEVNPGRAWFTHLSHELLHAELESELPQNVGIAFDGLKLSLCSGS
ncbi:MAG TPA: MBL fold metallo-hydrolase [Chthoniobacteraceae bacterium]|nr:MBL fold metallo-hydrolase [Chthoniobacteraceae bacterium]